MKKFIDISSPKFPILPGEKEELVNEGILSRQQRDVRTDPDRAIH
jgi:hypothetical protein